MERRAFKQAAFAVRDNHTALDIVQDAMFKLADRYRNRPPAELPPIFQSILQNTIRDFYRRQKVRSTWTSLISSFRSRDKGDEYDFRACASGHNLCPRNASRPASDIEISGICRIRNARNYVNVGRSIRICRNISGRICAVANKIARTRQ